MDSNENKKVGLLTELIAKLKELLSLIKSKKQNTMPSVSPLYQEALKYLGLDASPKDRASDGFGCAESVSEIVAGLVRGFPIATGTWSLYDRLKDSHRFVKLPEGVLPEPGDVILCVTGWPGSKPAIIPNGHAGIIGLEGTIMSNTSKTGLFESNYTFKSWNDRFVVQGAYEVHLFRLI